MQKNVNPHQVYIVDDNKVPDNKKHSAEFPKIDKIKLKLRKSLLRQNYEEHKKNIPNLEFDNFFHTNIIQNKRTKGFSGTGAWNTAAFKALKFHGRRYYLAFLDDDDEWHETYLSSIYQKASEVKAIASISGLKRIEKNKEWDYRVTEDNFNKESFFIGNPGLQASNFLIDLKTFWYIGGFDESLKSCTDRDLAIRLCEYNSIKKRKINFNQDVLVNYYADNNDRVSCSLKDKKAGLDNFYRKYSHQFPKEYQLKSLERAQKLFQYSANTGSECKKSDVLSFELPVERKRETVKPFNLIVGTISDCDRKLKKLLQSFSEIIKLDSTYLNDYRFLILDNSADEYTLTPLVEYFIKHKALKLQLIKNETFLFIAQNRTRLQKEIYTIGKTLFKGDHISWIVDDDHSFEHIAQKNIERPDYFSIISDKKRAGLDAFFSPSFGAPPLPFLSSLRGQLIDFYYSLTVFRSCDPDKIFELNKFQNSTVYFEDYYYDLSSQCQHLEYPYFFIEKQNQNQANALVFKDFLKQTAHLSKGVNISRLRTFNNKEFGSVLKKQSISRGGNTVIYNPELLLTENYTPNHDLYNRRSDFNWAIINRCIFKKNMQEILMPLYQDRKFGNSSISESKFEADIQGLAFYRLLRMVLEKENWHLKCHYNDYKKYYKRIKKDILHRVKINNLRSLVLLKLISTTLLNYKNWWYTNEYREDLQPFITENIIGLNWLEHLISRRSNQTFIKSIDDKLKIDNDFLDQIISDMKTLKNY